MPSRETPPTFPPTKNAIRASARRTFGVSQMVKASPAHPQVERDSGLQSRRSRIAEKCGKIGHSQADGARHAFTSQLTLAVRRTTPERCPKPESSRTQTTRPRRKSICAAARLLGLRAARTAWEDGGSDVIQAGSSPQRKTNPAWFIESDSHRHSYKTSHNPPRFIQAQSPGDVPRVRNVDSWSLAKSLSNP